MSDAPERIWATPSDGYCTTTDLPGETRDALGFVAYVRTDLHEALRNERDEWRGRAMKLRDERDAAKIAAKNYADFNHEWRKRAEFAEAQLDAVRESLPAQEGVLRERMNEIVAKAKANE